MNDQIRSCPDCQCKLETIRILDATAPDQFPGGDTGGAGHTTLSYSSPDATASAFNKKVPRQGVIKGYICPQCSRILMFGEVSDWKRI